MSRSKSPAATGAEPKKKADLGLKPTLVNMNANSTKLSGRQKAAYNQEYATGKAQEPNFRTEYALPQPNLPVAPDSPEKPVPDRMEQIQLSPVQADKPEMPAEAQVAEEPSQAFENNRQKVLPDSML